MHLCVSLFLPSPADSKRLQELDSKLCGAPAIAKEDALQPRPGLLGQGPAFSRLSMKGKDCAGMGSQDAPSPVPQKVVKHPLCTHGSHLATPSVVRAYRMHTAGKGTDLSESPSPSQATPWGVIPLPLTHPPPLQEGTIRVEGGLCPAAVDSVREGGHSLQIKHLHPGLEKGRGSHAFNKPRGLFPHPGPEK